MKKIYTFVWTITGTVELCESIILKYKWNEALPKLLVIYKEIKRDASVADVRKNEIIKIKLPKGIR